MGTLFEMFIWPFQKSFSLKKNELQSYYALELVYFWTDLSILAKTKLDKKFKKQKKPNASENNSTTAKVKNEKSYSVFIFLINEIF